MTYISKPNAMFRAGDFIITHVAYNRNPENYLYIKSIDLRNRLYHAINCEGKEEILLFSFQDAYMLGTPAEEYIPMFIKKEATS